LSYDNSPVAESQEDIGDRIRIAREARGMKQKDLATRLGVEQSHVWKWENNKRVPRMQTLATICDMLDVTLDYVIRGITERPKRTARGTVNVP
jgi:transcriptional regulator with XRE-family HTH domain